MRWTDRVLIEFDRALRTVAVVPPSSRPLPGAELPDSLMDGGENIPVSTDQQRHVAGLMRVNHVGEICAQALYHSQSLNAQRDEVRRDLVEAARDENDHLAWTAARLDELGSRQSLLNPLWYAGAFTLGCLAGRAGDAVSMGFLVETEKQVEQHLNGHLKQLPETDTRSRAIVTQMRDDEIRHAETGVRHGGKPLPLPVKLAMRAAAKVMTTTAYWI